MNGIIMFLNSCSCVEGRREFIDWGGWQAILIALLGVGVLVVCICFDVEYVFALHGFVQQLSFFRVHVVSFPFFAPARCVDFGVSAFDFARVLFDSSVIARENDASLSAGHGLPTMP